MNVMPLEPIPVSDILILCLSGGSLEKYATLVRVIYAIYCTVTTQQLCKQSLLAFNWMPVTSGLLELRM
jgi:hypothetical protein